MDRSTPQPIDADHLHVCLWLDPDPPPGGTCSSWCAGLIAAGQAGALHFASLAELIDFLTQLDRPPAVGGIR